MFNRAKDAQTFNDQMELRRLRSDNAALRTALLATPISAAQAISLDRAAAKICDDLQAENARLREQAAETVRLHAEWLRLSLDNGPLVDHYPTKLLKRIQAEHHAATNEALAALSAHIAAIDAATGGTK